MAYKHQGLDCPYRLESLETNNHLWLREVEPYTLAEALAEFRFCCQKYAYVTRRLVRISDWSEEPEPVLEVIKYYEGR